MDRAIPIHSVTIEAVRGGETKRHFFVPLNEARIMIRQLREGGWDMTVSVPHDDPMGRQFCRGRSVSVRIDGF